MPFFSHAFTIAHPIEAVFDLAMTTRYWPAWHPATVGVAGVTDRPLRLGDQVVERVVIAGRDGEGTWAVVACSRPRALTLEAQTGLGLTRIAYTLIETEAGTRFQRDLSYEQGMPELDRVMDSQSAQALVNLKALLERELAG